MHRLARERAPSPRGTCMRPSAKVALSLIPLILFVVVLAFLVSQVGSEGHGIADHALDGWGRVAPAQSTPR